MTDLMMSAAWLAVLGSALALAIALRAFGLAATYVRDCLHIGAGVWVLGWPFWRHAALPITIVAATAIAIAAVPRLARRSAVARHLVRSVTGDDEHWGGLALYTIAYAIFTGVGLGGDQFPAAAALLALSLGDGLGGAAGRALGTHHYRAPGGKRKSIEGSLVVFLGGVAAAVLAAALFDASLGIAGAVVLGCVAALAEAASPRGSDNLFVPFAVFIAAHFT
jgi:dolichol kinase